MPTPTHSPERPSKARRKGAGGVKAFISAAAVAATLAGWLAFAAEERSTAAPQPPSQIVAVQQNDSDD